MRDITACFSGHRHLPAGKTDEISSLIDNSIREAYENGYRRFICGGALGFDTLAALRVLKFRESCSDTKLILAIPCSDQSVRWSEKDRSVYRDILEKADEHVILSPDYYQGCMQTRNRYMIDRSSLCICYLYSLRGGTAYTVRYALHQNIRVDNLAMNHLRSDVKMRENLCCSMFISHSAEKNAGTVPLSLSKNRKLKLKDTSGSC